METKIKNIFEERAKAREAALKALKPVKTENKVETKVEDKKTEVK